MDETSNTLSRVSHSRNEGVPAAGGLLVGIARSWKLREKNKLSLVYLDDKEYKEKSMRKYEELYRWGRIGS